MGLEIIGAESMGLRSLCCRVALPDRRIVIDPGVALGFVRYGLPPHPAQIAMGRRIRERILSVLEDATDVVFSHLHGDHVPLVDANPYQLSVRSLPGTFQELRAWSKSRDDLTGKFRKRFQDLLDLSGATCRLQKGDRGEAVFFRLCAAWCAGQQHGHGYDDAGGNGWRCLCARLGHSAIG